MDNNAEDYEAYHYETSPYVIHMEENGKEYNFLLVERSMENDYCVTSLYDLNKLRAEPLYELHASGFASKIAEAVITSADAPMITKLFRNRFFSSGRLSAP